MLHCYISTGYEHQYPISNKNNTIRTFCKYSTSNNKTCSIWICIYVPCKNHKICQPKSMTSLTPSETPLDSIKVSGNTHFFSKNITGFPRRFLLEVFGPVPGQLQVVGIPQRLSGQLGDSTLNCRERPSVSWVMAEAALGALSLQGVGKNLPEAYVHKTFCIILYTHNIYL